MLPLDKTVLKNLLISFRHWWSCSAFLYCTVNAGIRSDVVTSLFSLNETVFVSLSDSHFVDIHREELIQGVSYLEPILDVLLRQKVIQQEGYNRILAKSVVQDQMRELFRILGPEGITESKKIFYEALKEKEPMLVKRLEGLR